MIDMSRITQAALNSAPFDWAMIDGLFSPRDGAELVATYPLDHFKTVSGYDGEKGYVYEARSLIHMKAEAASHPAGLSPVWQSLARDLLSQSYRQSLSRLSGIDLTAAPMEVNIFHYGPTSWLGPHTDLKDKIATHVLYFNRQWRPSQGGCLRILGSKDLADVRAEVPPLIGHSALLVRSDASWHAVTRVLEDSEDSRRSMTVTFYKPGSVSTMWPPGDSTPLHDYLPPSRATWPLQPLLAAIKSWTRRR